MINEPKTNVDEKHIAQPAPSPQSSGSVLFLKRKGEQRGRDDLNRVRIV